MEPLLMCSVSFYAFAFQNQDNPSSQSDFCLLLNGLNAIHSRSHRPLFFLLFFFLLNNLIGLLIYPILIILFLYSACI